MFGFGKLKLRGPDRLIVTEGPMIEDHASAESFGHQGLRKLPRVRLGKLALYYRDILLFNVLSYGGADKDIPAVP